MFRRFEFKVLAFILLIWAVSGAKALTPFEEGMIAKATPYFAQMRGAIEEVWPDLPLRSALPAQVEQESLWNPRAELCVPKPSCSRERGVGFGQFTVTPRFNTFLEVQRLHPKLKDWPWAERFDPERQFIAILAKDKDLYRVCRPLMSNDWGGLACTMSSYNGGYGGFTSDRKLCSNTKGCNPRVWTGNIEKTSLKAKQKLQGYGKSFFEINREYVRNVLIVRRTKYEGLL